MGEGLALWAHRLDRLVWGLCCALLGLLALVLMAVVILRYVFGLGFLELQDLANYAFASFVVLGLPVALRSDAHVRVDVFRATQAPRTQWGVDLAGYLLLLLPVFGLTLWFGWPDVAYSWSILEGSVETGGLPGLFLVKTTLPIACLLMMLQGAAILLRSRP